MPFRRSLLLSFAAASLLSSCTSRVEAPRLPAAASPKTGVIHLGMPFAEAETRLMRYAVSEVGLQVLLTKKAAERGAELHFYRVGAAGTLELHSGLAAGVRIVTYLALSPDSPRSPQSKIDPAYERFLKSFVQCDAVDLENRLNGSPAAAAAAAATIRQ